MKSHRVFLNLGSNIDREHHLRAGLRELRHHYDDLECSAVYETAAVGFEGERFWNLAVSLSTQQSLAELATSLRQLEYDYGRPADAQRFSNRTLDIDIVMFDDLCGSFEGVELPRPELLENAFVLAPMADLAPAMIHPGVGISFEELWKNYDQVSQPLKQLDIDFSR